MKNRHYFASFALIAVFTLGLAVSSAITVSAQTPTPTPTPTVTPVISPTPTYSPTPTWTPTSVSSCYQFNANLTLGATGADVVALQSFLINNGFGIPLITSGQAVKGYYGLSTRTSLTRYQATVGLTTTGVLDAATRAKLNSCPTTVTPVVYPPTTVGGGSSGGSSVGVAVNGGGGGGGCYVFSVNLTIGSTGADVVALQTLMIVNGFDIPLISSGQVAKGYFGPSTSAALGRYQASVGLPATGELDVATRAKLNSCTTPPPVTVVCPPGFTCVPINNNPTTPVINTPVYPSTQGTINTSNITTTATDSSVVTTLTNGFSDRVGTWGNFGPGNGVNYSGGADWNWNMTLNLGSARTIKSIAVYHTGPNSPAWAAGPEGWSSASSDDLGRSSFPLGVVWNEKGTGALLNSSYNQTLGSYLPGSISFTLFGQVEHTAWTGGIVVVNFTDGTRVVGTIPASSYAPPAVGGGSTNQSSITVTYPQTGNILDDSGGKSSGLIGRITWNTIGAISNTLGIALISPSGVPIKYIANGLSPSLNSYPWPYDYALQNGSYAVQVYEEVKGGGASGMSGYFQIVNSPAGGGSTSNQSPVITGGTFPTSLSVGQIGTWSVNAYDPQNGSLSYSVDWGDTGSCPVGYTCASAPTAASQTSTFTHSYSNAGIYTIRFTVRNSSGLSAQTSTTVTIGSNSTYGNPPVISSITPASASFGQTVTLAGSGFSGHDTIIYLVNGSDKAILGGGMPISDSSESFNVAGVLCRQYTGGSGLPCSSYMTVNPGTYQIYIVSNSGQSNTVNFTVLSSSPSTQAPTATLLVNGQRAWTYNVGETTSYTWSSTNADTFSSTYTANNPTQCGAGNWWANTANGSIGSYLGKNYAGCAWAVTYTAKNSQTGQSASDAVKVTVNPLVTPVTTTMAPATSVQAASVQDALAICRANPGSCYGM